MDEITVEEVKLALKRLRNGRAAGPDGIRAEHLKALLCNPTSMSALTKLLNFCWREERAPSAWHLAHVSAIYKKGLVHDAANYRPISLLDITYKLLASIIRMRLVGASAEDRLSAGQFGFRSGFSTQDAIFVLRRRLESAWAQRNGRLYVLALDWAKAFDSLDPEAMLEALRRFGLPRKKLTLAEAIH